MPVEKKQPWYKHPAARVARVVLSSLLKLVMTIVIIAAITGSIVGCVLAVYVVTQFNGSTGIPDLSAITDSQTSMIMTYDEKTGQYVEQQRLEGTNSIYTPLDQIPLNMQNAVIAIEDKRFRDHYGVDWKRTVSAFANLLLKFSSKEYGGSTITQQLIKVQTGDDDHSIERKITEILRAIEMEKNHYTKDQILEAYLNVLPLTGNIQGVGAAANYYFGVDVQDLTLAQCALIAGITQNPSKYNPYTHPENIRVRQRVVLQEMFAQGLITEDEYIQAYNEELIFKSSAKIVKVQDYYTDMVIEDVIHDLMDQYGYSYLWSVQLVYHGGLRIYSCEDVELQQAAEAIYANESNFPAHLEGDEKDPQSAIFIMDYSGKAVATVGGRGEKTANRVLNRATSSMRQPGSCMKPLTGYLLAIRWNLAHFSTQIQDCYLTLPDGTNWPVNYNSKLKDNGMVLLDSALQRSLNTTSARMVKMVSPEEAFKFITESLRLSTLVKSERINGNVYTDIDLSPMALGGLTHGVYVREMAAAYQIFGNGGYYNEPYSYTKVEQAGQTLLEHTDVSIQVVDEDTAYVMNRLLQNVIQGPNGTAKSLKSAWSGWEVFCKTGTTQNDNDVYLSGGTPYYVGACWFGYDENIALKKSQTSAARNLWSLVMKELHKDLEPCGFVPSAGTEEHAYCTSSGMLATEHCPKTLIGVYKKILVPDVCTEHQPQPPTQPSEGIDPGTEGTSTTTPSTGTTAATPEISPAA